MLLECAQQHAGHAGNDSYLACEAPTLVICCDDDIPSFVDAARCLSENIADAKKSWIAGTRHASVLEQPQQVIALMKAFLESKQ